MGDICDNRYTLGEPLKKGRIHAMTTGSKKTFLLLPVMLLAAVASAQQNPYASTKVDYGQTTANPNDYSVGYGHVVKRPRNYNYYYYNDANQYALSPYLNLRPYQPSRRITGPARPYSDTEYGKLVLSAINSSSIQPSNYRTENTESIIQETTSTPSGIRVYKPAETDVVDVLDRGIIVVPTREQMRLRGVRLPTETSTDEVTRLYAREAQATIRKLTEGKKIYVLFDTPLRDSQGNILGTVYLPDGTELNRMMIDLGYGTVNADDFAPDVDFQDLQLAQDVARSKHAGMWSKTQ